VSPKKRIERISDCQRCGREFVWFQRAPWGGWAGGEEDTPAPEYVPETSVKWRPGQHPPSQCRACDFMYSAHRHRDHEKKCKAKAIAAADAIARNVERVKRSRR